MDAPHRLRMKIGPHEFEAEGTAEEVTEQFAQWKEIVISFGAASVSPAPAAPTAPAAAYGSPGQAQAATSAQAADAPPISSEVPPIFQVDERKHSVALKVHPQGESRDQDAVLLVLYGMKRLLLADEPLTGQIKDALEASGIRVERVDRITAGYLKQGLLLKSGFAKGGRYRLTMTGLARAEALARELASQMA